MHRKMHFNCLYMEHVSLVLCNIHNNYNNNLKTKQSTSNAISMDNNCINFAMSDASTDRQYLQEVMSPDTTSGLWLEDANP